MPKPLGERLEKQLYLQQNQNQNHNILLVTHQDIHSPGKEKRLKNLPTILLISISFSCDKHERSPF